MKIRPPSRYLLSACLSACLALYFHSAAAVETPAAPESLEVSGMIKPFREVRLASRAQGVIQTIKREGDAVREGESVMQLDDAVERMQLQQQEMLVEMRQAQHDAAELLGQGDGISRLEAKERYFHLQVALSQVDQTRALLDRLRVKAPFDGVVVERMRAEGEAVDQFIPVLTMVDLSKLYFEAFVPAHQIGLVREGQKAGVTVEVIPDHVFEGEVDLVSPVVNPASAECKIRVVLENTEGALRSGLPGKAIISLAPPEETPAPATETTARAAPRQDGSDPN